ncbi:MAG: SDR family oxidoreductase [Elusimicrobiales bacterium]|nr:SDR family oxidoreductase [Elusimicrobiales bacterium]
MKKPFAGKTAVITGASSGIGRETALALAAAGARVVLWARNAAKLRRAADEIKTAGFSAETAVVDVRDRARVFSAMEDAAKLCGGVDILVNNAGVGYFGSAQATPEAQLRRVLETNFYGSVYCAQAAIPFMRGRGGKIAFISSILGKRGAPYYAAYCASKFAVQGFAEALRTELEDLKIKVIVVCPTATETEFFSNGGWDGVVLRRPRGPVIMSARAAARAVVSAIRRSRRETVLSLPAKLLAAANAAAPSMVDIAVSKFFK